MDSSTIDDNKYLFTEKNVYTNLSFDDLANHARNDKGFIKREEKTIIVDSGEIKGRLPEDRYIVDTKYAKKNVWWKENGSDNKVLKPKHWELIRQEVCLALSKEDLYVVDGLYNFDERNTIGIRFITTNASAAVFFKTISVRVAAKDKHSFDPQWVMIHAPDKQIENIKEKNLHSSRVIATNLKQRESIIAGTAYFSEISKQLLSISSYYLSLADIGIFYCATSVSNDGRSTMLLGLSGSGKTAISLDDDKSLVSNDAVAWTENQGLYSLESGFTIKAESYPRDSKIINSIAENTALIENPNFDENNTIIFGEKNSDHTNTFITFPRESLANTTVQADNPSTIILLSKDSKGVLPRVSKLTKGQAIYYFLSGYTSTSVGLEDGVFEPKLEFSSCYAQPFLLLEPTRYAKILRQRLKHSNASIYLINVGWIEGDHKTGRRVPVEETKAVVKYLLNKPEHVNFFYKRQKYFNFKTLSSIEDNDEIMYLKNNWEDTGDQNKSIKELVKSFVKNYEQFEKDDFANKYKKFGPTL